MIRSLIVVLCLSAIAWADPLNGSFEDPLGTGWSTSGTGVVTREMSTTFSPDATGEIDATDGDWFAFVSNSPFSFGDPDVGTLTSDLFTVTSAGGTLSFDYQFFTEEFAGLDYFPGDPADYFEIWLIPIIGTPVLLASDDISNTDFDYLSKIYAISGGAVVDQALPLASYSGAIAAGQYSLEFNVYDDFDGTFDSALLVDNVLLVNNPVLPPGGGDPVPEPGTWVLIGAAGVAGAIARRRKKS